MLNESDFVRLRMPGVGEWTQARSALVPDDAEVIAEPALTPAGVARADVPDPAPAEQAPQQDLVRVGDVLPVGGEDQGVVLLQPSAAPAASVAAPVQASPGPVPAPRQPAGPDTSNPKET